LSVSLAASLSAFAPARGNRGAPRGAHTSSKFPVFFHTVQLFIPDCEGFTKAHAKGII
jgi:hypothetical protein